MPKPLIREASLEEILPLRKRMLIEGTGRPTPYFDGEDVPSTLHIAAFDGEACVACSTWMPSEWDSCPAWRLRGMATDTAWQGKGIGRAILTYAEKELRRRGATTCWCTARTSAEQFYQKTGWRTVSEEFNISGIGPHVRMTHDL